MTTNFAALKKPGNRVYKLFLCVSMMSGTRVLAQSQTGNTAFSPGILITLFLVALVVLFMVAMVMVKTYGAVQRLSKKKKDEDDKELDAYIINMEAGKIDRVLQSRSAALHFVLPENTLLGTDRPEDRAGVIQHIRQDVHAPFIPLKRKAAKRPEIDPQLARLVTWYVICASFWLIFGTTVGEYVGIKFVLPDADHQSWLSFGRLRPVHTNAVFWGWASIGMLGMGYYVVPKVSNAPLASIKKGYITLITSNLAVLGGTLLLMAGVNNGGGEFREYIWPVMVLFGIGLVVTLINFLNTIKNRKTTEIYFSNWGIVSAIIFVLVIVFVSYWPSWQDGLGETIMQGYYMHESVGMWFMMFNLGLLYYFLPQQLNRPVYSYSLGILAFWTQILFYTVIGTHHFIFSAIPWWLQTVAIVGSVGMIIPVVSGTTNFMLTFKDGGWAKIASSYTLPFFLTGILFYFIGSMQGVAQAFRETNLIWHFTDFNVAHSHLTMYGIITFILWACMYALLPRLTGKEPAHGAVGFHFWLALIGLLFYAIPLMIGGTLKGQMWMEGKPFIDSVILMADYWLWRAIGGSMMWLSHLVFAYNVYSMIKGTNVLKNHQLQISRVMEPDNVK